MPHIGIGIGIDPRAVENLMRELCIKPDRIEALHAILEDAHEKGHGNPAEDLQRFIAFSTKANELAFLCFMTGLGVGAASAISQVSGEVGGMLKTAMLTGAEHSDEIKELLNNAEGTPAGATATANPAKKKDPAEDERMYG
jgi:hypothetical protein